MYLYSVYTKSRLIYSYYFYYIFDKDMEVFTHLFDIQSRQVSAIINFVSNHLMLPWSISKNYWPGNNFWQRSCGQRHSGSWFGFKCTYMYCTCMHNEELKTNDTSIPQFCLKKVDGISSRQMCQCFKRLLNIPGWTYVKLCITNTHVL